MWAGLCRCCLASNCDLLIEDGKENIKQKFAEITSIEVNPYDNLPQNICTACFDSLNAAHIFRSEVIKMNNELKLQLQKFLENANNNADVKIVMNKEEENEDTDDFGTNPLKQLEAIIKSEPNDSDDDYYYVLVVDPKETEDDSEMKQDVKAEVAPVVENIKSEPKEIEMLPVQTDHDNFESSIESFIISEVPINVPATILENEEESQDNDIHYYNSTNNVENQDTNSQDNQNYVKPEDSQNKLETIKAEIIKGSNANFVKLLTTTRADGTIVLKSSDNKITYLTDTQLVTNDDEDDDDDQLSQREVILCEGDDSSQFQILKCDGNELVIEYADDGEIATILQQEDGTFLCECGKAFEDLSDYEKHQSNHCVGDLGGPAIHSCNLCSKGFESSEVLTGHMLLHNVSALLVLCPFCGQLIKRNSLTQHIRNHHTKRNGKPQCSVCMKTFANPNNLKRHMTIHTGLREFECDICLKRFHQKITMQTHRLTHINPLACIECDEIFTTSVDLTNHKESNECSKSKIIKVKEDLMKTVKQEVTTNAGKLVGYACSLCQKMFSVESALEQHLENMHMVNPMELLCSECGEVLPTKKEMQTHLHTHRIVKSKNAKRYECGECGKGCTSQAMLIMHERVHTNERPYSCQLCTLRFKTKTHLRTHQLTHTREKKFGCSVCMKFFALKGNLVVHLRTHTGERPYVCSLCGDAFIDSKYLKKHKLKKHAIDNVPWNQY